MKEQKDLIRLVQEKAREHKHCDKRPPERSFLPTTRMLEKKLVKIRTHEYNIFQYTINIEDDKTTKHRYLLSRNYTLLSWHRDIEFTILE